MTDNYLKDPRADTFEGWAAALAIFQKYEPKGPQARFMCDAQHDILYCPAKPDPKVDEEDAKTLRGLGFHWASDVDCWAKFT